MVVKKPSVHVCCQNSNIKTTLVLRDIEMHRIYDNDVQTSGKSLSWYITQKLEIQYELHISNYLCASSLTFYRCVIAATFNINPQPVFIVFVHIHSFYLNSRYILSPSNFLHSFSRSTILCNMCVWTVCLKTVVCLFNFSFSCLFFFSICHR